MQLRAAAWHAFRSALCLLRAFCIRSVRFVYRGGGSAKECNLFLSRYPSGSTNTAIIACCARLHGKRGAPSLCLSAPRASTSFARDERGARAKWMINSSGPFPPRFSGEASAAGWPGPRVRRGRGQAGAMCAARRCCKYVGTTERSRRHNCGDRLGQYIDIHIYIGSTCN